MALFGFIVYKDRKADSPSSELEYERSQKLYERWEKERLQKRLEECELEKYTTAMQRLKVQDSAKKILNIK